MLAWIGISWIWHLALAWVFGIGIQCIGIGFVFVFNIGVNGFDASRERACELCVFVRTEMLWLSAWDRFPWTYCREWTASQTNPESMGIWMDGTFFVGSFAMNAAAFLVVGT